MISYLKGKIKHKSAMPKKDNFLIVEVAGVGYKVYVLDKLINLVKVGDELELYTHTQVAENILDLYGFSALEELNFFEILISISGVGPKSAMGILQKAKIEDLKKAASSGNSDILNKISGIGPKTAQKIVAGLRDKLGGADAGISGWDDGFGDALEALIGLGYSASQAREALSRCQSTEMSERVKEALKYLAL